MSIPSSFLNVSSNRIDIVQAMRDNNGKLGVDKEENIAFYSGMHILLHPDICKRGTDFIKTLPKIDINSIFVLEKSSDSDKEKIRSTFKKALEHAEKYARKSNDFISGSFLATARFDNIPTAKATQVIAPDGKALAANRIKVGGKNVAIACQYPQQEHLGSYLTMLHKNRTPVLVILASEADISSASVTPTLPDYFRQRGSYSNSTVTTEVHFDGEVTLKNNIKIARHTLSISIRGDKDIPIPVIHCRAGVGRTGQLIATTELFKKERNLLSIMTDMRTSRNHKMVQTDKQLEQVVTLAKKLGIPLY